GAGPFLFVLAIGLLALRVAVGLWLPVIFVLGGLGGAVLHWNAVSLSLGWVEIGVTGSLALAGFFLAQEAAPRSLMMLGLGAIAGLFHGYAFGEAIFGAEMTPLWSYLLGLTLVQLAVAAAVYGGAKVWGDRVLKNPATVLRYAGFTFLGAGLALLSGVVV
ncbi:MAG: hypothetical protein HC824_16255, partial [Synechococcales cyanobacterium RM1_1_8]|nr:hypothetical protein [Synechococcales cyanobacterium RM1_1_8]